MNDPSSRYQGLPLLTLTITDPTTGDPKEIRYTARRFIPLETGQMLVEHAVGAGERLDHLAARYLGDPMQFWRIADASLAIAPEELTDQPGNRVPITLPAPKS
jgi:hypothetical protein